MDISSSQPPKAQAILLKSAVILSRQNTCFLLILCVVSLVLRHYLSTGPEALEAEGDLVNAATWGWTDGWPTSYVQCLPGVMECPIPAS